MNPSLQEGSPNYLPLYVHQIPNFIRHEIDLVIANAFLSIGLSSVAFHNNNAFIRILFGLCALSTLVSLRLHYWRWRYWVARQESLELDRTEL